MFSINFAAKKLSFDGVSHGRRGSQNSNIPPGVAIFNCWNLRCKGSSFQLSFDFSPPKTSATALKLAGFSYLQGSGCQLWTSDSSIFFSGDTRTAICFNRYQFCNHSNCQTTFCRQFIAIWNMLILFLYKAGLCYLLCPLFTLSYVYYWFGWNYQKNIYLCFSREYCCYISVSFIFNYVFFSLYLVLISLHYQHKICTSMGYVLSFICVLKLFSMAESVCVLHLHALEKLYGACIVPQTSGFV